ncbi:MAG TPA: hypothetical protein VHG09_09925 [Longimicrobiales bacterium]|nr:hypothetical protein [Longimicrobiales bacterium]
MQLASRWSLSVMMLALVSGGCSGEPATQGAEPTLAGENARADDAEHVIEVAAIARGDQHLFELSTATVPSGWTTFVFANRAHVDHFALLTKLPDSVDVEDYRVLTQVAQNFLDGARGVPISHPAAGLELPAWYADVQVMGGPGMTSAGHTSETTVELEPGEYVLECYIITADGRFHHVAGMVEGLTVTNARSEAPEPQGTLELTLRNDGIQVDGSASPGMHTIAVHFAEQQQYANLGRNDLHLVRLEEDTDLKAVADWINTTNPGAFVSPGSPAEFLGGTQEMPAGRTAYFTANLTPGRYAWISEVPDPADKGMLRTFTVSAGR